MEPTEKKRMDHIVADTVCIVESKRSKRREGRSRSKILRSALDVFCMPPEQYIFQNK